MYQGIGYVGLWDGHSCKFLFCRLLCGLVTRFPKEAMTGKAPYSEDIKGSFTQERIQTAIKKGQLPKKPKTLTKETEILWQQICLPCWEFDPAKRISANEAKIKFSTVEIAENQTTETRFRPRSFLAHLVLYVMALTLPALYKSGT